MGLLDRVKASQTGITPAAPGASETPQPGVAPVATAAPPTPAPTRQSEPAQAAPAQPQGGLSARQAAQAHRAAIEPPAQGLSPAFTATKVQVHARLLER